MLTRAFDIFIALIGFLLLIVMWPVIGLLIKFDSQGPVLYNCNRVGKDFKNFKMYKFRTMYETPLPLGTSVSPQGDPRVTSIGRILRRLKLNEFPQFINVLKGEMSVVGPRPESPDLAAKYPAEARPIFSVKPGLVGPNQILGRNEEESYPQGVDPDTYYIEEILPQKLPLDLQYIQKKSLLLDLKYLFMGAWATIAGAIKRQHLTDNRTQILMLVADSICCPLSFMLAYFIRYENLLPLASDPGLRKILFLTVLARITLLIYMGCYQNLIRYLSIQNLKQVFLGVSLGTGILLILSYFLSIPLQEFGRGVFVIDWLCLTILLTGYRILMKTIYQHNNNNEVALSEPRRALIWGAGNEGQWCLRYLRESSQPSYEVIGFIDEEPKMQNRRLDGLRVLGDHHHLEVLAKLYKIQEIFIAGPVSTQTQMEKAQQTCKNFSITLKRFLPRTTEKIPLDEALATALSATG